MSKKFARGLLEGMGEVSRPFMDAGISNLIDRIGLDPSAKRAEAAEKRKFDQAIKLAMIQGLMKGETVDPAMLNSIISGEGLQGDKPITLRTKTPPKSEKVPFSMRDTRTPTGQIPLSGKKLSLEDINWNAPEIKGLSKSKKGKELLQTAVAEFLAQPKQGLGHLALGADKNLDFSKVLGGSVSGATLTPPKGAVGWGPDEAGVMWWTDAEGNGIVPRTQ